MSEKAPEISIVIPVYNEAAIVQSAAEELVRALDEQGLDYELILAENGSSDSTPQIVDGLASRLPRLRALHVGEPNYGRALKEGILSARGTYVISDEIDLCDLDFYRRALPLLRSGEAEMVVGSKAARGARDERPLLRRAGTKVINGVLRLSLGFRGTDTHGLKAFRRDALLPVARACLVDKDMFASELVIRAGR
ncbi:MAG TPA: glycosyl transferase family 2, partial [Myxococcales bacterium]|nr:glycosyl transferase family 2 [Myxococcales bacterium]